MDITAADLKRIEAEIQDDTSPVGIDAKKTHILILLRLEQMQKQLDRIEGPIQKHD